MIETRTPNAPGAEYLRRFWQVVAPSTDATRTPAQVRVFGEDLVLFRDGSGAAGLLYPRRPAFSLYDHLENLAPDEIIEVDATSLGTGGPVVADFNWFQHYENVMDPFHVVMLHDAFSGTQFIPDMGKMPDVTWAFTPRGIKSQQVRKLDDGSTLRRVTELALPTGRVVPSPTLAVKGPAMTSTFRWKRVTTSSRPAA